MNEEVQNYIKQMRQDGKSDNEIKQALRVAGWTEEMLKPFFSSPKRRLPKSALIILITLCCIILIGVGTYFLFVNMNSDSTETTDVVQNINETTIVNTQQDSNSLKILTTSDLQACDEITDYFKKDSCLNELLISTQDPRICIKLSDPSDHTECFNNTITESHTIDICNDIDYSSSLSSLDKEYCIIALAVANSDILICDNISSMDSFYDMCVDSVAASSNDISICNNRGSVSKSDWCIHFFAVDKRDVDICKKMQTINYMADCYWEVSRAKQDVNICDQFKIDFKKYLFASMDIEDDVDQCYAWHAWLSPSYDIHNLAVPNENIWMCDKILQEEERDSCYQLIAEMNQDKIVCEKIIDVESKEECYSNIE